MNTWVEIREAWIVGYGYPDGIPTDEQVFFDMLKQGALDTGSIDWATVVIP